MRAHCFFMFYVWLSVSVTAAFGTQSTPNTYASAASQSSLFRSANVLHSQRKKNQDIESVKIATEINGGSTEVPSFPKSQEEEAFIREALMDNVMFADLPELTLSLLIQAFERITVSQNQVIMTQGDFSEGDYAYLVGSGKCAVIVDGQVAPEPYGTLKPKAIFGELGVLFGKRRLATVIPKTEEVTLFRVNGSTFKDVINNQSGFNDDPELLQKIDQAINQVAGTKSLYGGNIIRPWKPGRAWLWRQWKGTVLKNTYKAVLGNMLLSLLVIVFTKRLTDPTWKFGLRPDQTHDFVKVMDIIRKLWNYQTSLTTFILTFFLNNAYSFWKEIYQIARIVQGKLSDFHMILATNCQRNPDGTYTSESEKLMDDVSSSSRLFHALFWASCARQYAVLRTPKGLERMASRGLMTSRQLRVLQSLDIPDNQLHSACVEWMMIRANQGMADGTVCDPSEVRLRLLDQMGQLRGQYDAVGGKLACRMPLPYTHFVQILVDSFVILSPVALYPELGAYSIFCVGVLTLFYAGLMDLAKVFLDPLDNDDDFTKNSIDMDIGVFIRESNAGSVRWKNAAASVPFDVPAFVRTSESPAIPEQ